MDIASVYRSESGRCVATLVRLLGNINLAEEAVQDAFAVALEKWETLPPNPGAWIVTTARNRAVDRLRRESTREARHAQALLLHQPDQTQEVGPVKDDQLRLIFTCCHPALAHDARTALTLRLLGGLEVPEIARAYLVPEATVAQRIVRAKKKIRDTGIPYRVPAAELTEARRPARLGAADEQVLLPDQDDRNFVQAGSCHDPPTRRGRQN
jgi:RNA polymerase sigma-70 factor, ECF subfamily